jgi:hypothetical protein
VYRLLYRFKDHLKQRQAGKADTDSYDMHKRIEKWYWKQVRAHISRQQGSAACSAERCNCVVADAQGRV